MREQVFVSFGVVWEGLWECLQVCVCVCILHQVLAKEKCLYIEMSLCGMLQVVGFGHAEPNTKHQTSSLLITSYILFSCCQSLFIHELSYLNTWFFFFLTKNNTWLLPAHSSFLCFNCFYVFSCFFCFSF